MAMPPMPACEEELGADIATPPGPTRAVLVGVDTAKPPAVGTPQIIY